MKYNSRTVELKRQIARSEFIYALDRITPHLFLVGAFLLFMMLVNAL